MKPIILVGILMVVLGTLALALARTAECGPFERSLQQTRRSDGVFYH